MNILIIYGSVLDIIKLVMLILIQSATISYLILSSKTCFLCYFVHSFCSSIVATFSYTSIIQIHNRCLLGSAYHLPKLLKKSYEKNFCHTGVHNIIDNKLCPINKRYPITVNQKQL